MPRVPCTAKVRRMETALQGHPLRTPGVEEMQRSPRPASVRLIPPATSLELKHQSTDSPATPCEHETDTDGAAGPNLRAPPLG